MVQAPEIVRILHALARSSVRQRVLVFLAGHRERPFNAGEIAWALGISRDNVIGALNGDKKNYRAGDSLVGLQLVARRNRRSAISSTNYTITVLGYNVITAEGQEIIRGDSRIEERIKHMSESEHFPEIPDALMRSIDRSKVLVFICDNDMEYNANELAMRLGISYTQVKGALSGGCRTYKAEDSLVGLGLASSRQCGPNGSITVYRITPSGKELAGPVGAHYNLRRRRSSSSKIVSDDSTPARHARRRASA